MKKLVIIAMLIAMVSSVMATQNIEGGAPTGAVPVMMTIAGFCQIALPDTIVLVSTDPADLGADWDNTGALALMEFKSNFTFTMLIEATTDGGYAGIGTWNLEVADVDLPGDAALVQDTGDQIQWEMGTVLPAVWHTFTLEVVLENVDLSVAAYDPAAVEVGHIDVTVVP